MSIGPDINGFVDRIKDLERRLNNLERTDQGWTSYYNVADGETYNGKVLIDTDRNILQATAADARGLVFPNSVQPWRESEVHPYGTVGGPYVARYETEIRCLPTDTIEFSFHTDVASGDTVKWKVEFGSNPASFEFEIVGPYSGNVTFSWTHDFAVGLGDFGANSGAVKEDDMTLANKRTVGSSAGSHYAHPQALRHLHQSQATSPSTSSPWSKA